MLARTPPRREPGLTLCVLGVAVAVVALVLAVSGAAVGLAQLAGMISGACR